MAKLRIGGRVVDQNVEAAEIVTDAREGLLYLLQLTDVAGHGGGVAPGGDDRVGHGLTVLPRAAGDDDMRPLAGQQVGNGLTDTAAGAGHESDFSIKVKQESASHAESFVFGSLEAGALDDLEAHVLQQGVHVDELGEAFVLRLAVVEAVVDLLHDACQTE